MNDLIINVEKSTRMVLMTKTTVGNDMENLQERIVFKFTDTFVDGQARLEYKIGSTKSYIVLTKENNTYIVPVQNVLTQEGRIEMQLVITEGTEEENIPVFKSNVFYLYCNRSINAVNEPEEGYDLWIEQANAKLNLMDEALTEVDNLDIDASKSGDTATVTITNKEGTTKSVSVSDGRNGVDGEDAKINGVNTITIEAGNNVSLDQTDETLTINAIDTTDYNSFTNKPSINSVTLSGNKTSSDLGLQPAGNYVTPIDYATSSTGGVIKVSNGDYGLTIDEGVLKGTVKTYSQFNDASSKSVVTKGTLNNVITGKGLIDNTYHDSTKQDIEDNNLDTVHKTVPSAINEVNSIAKGANHAVGYNNYSAMITAINAMDDEEFSMGQNIYVITVNVPDLWVSSVESTSSTYTYVNDATVINDLETNGYIQVGYYKLSMLETQKVDLTNYVTNTDYAESDTGGVIKIGSSYGTAKSSSGNLIASVKNYEDYSSAGNYIFVGKGTLENAITGKGLVSNTDYASSSKGGVIKPSANYGSQVSSSGIFYGSTRTYSQYNDGNSNVLICKGTLENVLVGKGLNQIVTLTQAQYDALATKDPDTYYYIEES